MKNTTCYSQSETVPEKRELSAVDSGDQETKIMKRRRRSPSLGYGEQQQPTIFKIDQVASNATTNAINNKTTTSVKRSSRFRGVSRHRWTGRYEAHLWDKASWNVTQKKKGKQGAVYLGAYDVEEAAARAYDLAAVKYWGTSTYTNFPISVYEKEIEIMRNMSKEEYLASLRRRSSGFARGASKYRGVARHHQNGRWEARIGRVFGNKYLYLGTYGTQEEAAKAYDIAAIEYRGMNAVTNFDMSTYIRWLKPNNGDNSFALSSSSDQILPAHSMYLNQESDPTSSFAVNNLTIFPKHEVIGRKMPLSPCKKETSPTALGLLLRSSMFKELIEKTTNEENEHKEVQVHDGSAFDVRAGNENRVGFGPKKEDDSLAYDREGMFFRDFFPYRSE